MNDRATPDQTPIPAGEDLGERATFSADQIAVAFGVDLQSVAKAAAGELGRPPDVAFDSTDAQHLAEVLLPDRPLTDRMAALMELGAFTPRVDAEWGLGDTVHGEESDRLAARADTPADDLASKQSSYDPATQEAR